MPFILICSFYFGKYGSLRTAIFMICFSSLIWEFWLDSDHILIKFKSIELIII